MAGLHKKRFPGESAEYRVARNELLEAERQLRRQIEAVAAQRRDLPAGGKLMEDYVFAGVAGDIRFTELFAPGKDSLIVYNMMFAAGADPCPMCTALVDGLNGNAVHVEQRVNLAIVAAAPIEQLTAYADERGWNNLRLLSSHNNSYNRDFHAETADGQWPMLNVFSRSGDQIIHNWGSELLFVDADPGQNQRHVDLIWPLWNLLDLTPEGRGDNWFPSRRY